MIDLTKKKLPDSIIIENSIYRIKTDFRLWIRFKEILNKNEGSILDFDFLYVDEIPQDRLSGFKELIKFYYPEELLPNKEYIDTGNGVKFYDWKIDGSMIFAAFYQCYNIDLTEKDLHFHKFLALFNSLQNTRLNEIMSFRAYRDDKTSYESRMKRLRDQWELPEEEDETADDILEKFNSQFD